MAHARRVELMAFNTATFEQEIRKAGFKPDDFEKVFPLFKTQPYMAFSLQTSDEIVQRFIKAYDDVKLEKEGN